jgi:hypothetical protein
MVGEVGELDAGKAGSYRWWRSRRHDSDEHVQVRKNVVLCILQHGSEQRWSAHCTRVCVRACVRVLSRREFNDCMNDCTTTLLS